MGLGSRFRFEFGVQVRSLNLGFELKFRFEFRFESSFEVGFKFASEFMVRVRVKGLR